MSKTITTAQTTTLIVDASNENRVVDIGGSITVANGHGMVNNMGFHDGVMTTSGAIIADGIFKSGMFSEGHNAILQVDTLGTIHGYNGMAFYGEGTKAENLGTTTAANIGICGNAQNTDVVNMGAIEAKTGLWCARRTLCDRGQGADRHPLSVLRRSFHAGISPHLDLRL